MALTFRTSAHSEIGLVRKNNQDSAYVAPALIAVADGMGGAAAGDLASAVAITHVAETEADLGAKLAAASVKRPDAAPTGLPEGPEGDLLAVLADTLAKTNEHLATLVTANHDLEGMGSTLCVVALTGDKAAIVNIGDSRAYLLRDGVLSRVSHDHSWVQALVDQGRISEEDALEHPHRSLILKVLNGSPHHEPDFDLIDVRVGDRFLVCSDGLCGLVPDAAIAERIGLADRDATVDALVDLAHSAGGHDNITIIVSDVVDGEPEGGVHLLGSVSTTKISEAGAPAPASPRLTARAGRRPNRSPEVVRYSPAAGSRVRRAVRLALGILVPVVLILGGAFGWYTYTQTRFYLGPNNTTVAVFQGVPDHVFGQPLNKVVADDGVQLADLPPFYLDKVKGLIQVADLTTGQARLVELKGMAARCVAQRAAAARASEQPSPSPTPAPPSASPSSPAASPSTPAASPSTPAASETPTTPTTLSTPATPAPPASPEDC